ncbi:MAG: glucose-6-phosphate dehydrogenase [Bradymonadales bacterium]|nr:glucose-6-phosphate dehydrogenase [Bradymonadales bacterium]
MTTEPSTDTQRLSPRPVGPCAMVIFGAAGDLTKRKLLPALHFLARDDLLPEPFAVIGFARRDWDSERFRRQMESDIQAFLPGNFRQEAWDWLKNRLYFVPGSFQDPEAFSRLREMLAEVDRLHQTGRNTLYYLATPPEQFAIVAQQLGAAGLTPDDHKGWSRVIIEKPFGRDLESARSLNQKLRSTLAERQIYRIDHYLGKETVQNLLVFRFANGIFEPIWNRRYVDHIQITVAEELGVEGRANYYETSGAIRDMVANHLFQLLSLIAMEPPNSFDANAVRDEKEKVLAAIAPMSPEDVLVRAVRGQYGEGMITTGQIVPAYRQEPNVYPESRTETYAAMKLMVDNWRWAGVPFYLRTGKRMRGRLTEIVVHFKRAPHILFRETPVHHLNPNMLIIRMQPREGISLQFSAKVPGPVLELGNVNMDFCYADYFGTAPATGYETLIHDAMRGDATLFQRGDSVESAWKVVEPILDVWSALPAREFPNYPAGTWGPAVADQLLARDGRHWYNLSSTLRC